MAWKQHRFMEYNIHEKLGGKLIVSMPADFTTGLFCKSCEYPLKTREDAISFQKTKGVCARCDNRWSNVPSVSWDGGSESLPRNLAREGYSIDRGTYVIDFQKEWIAYKAVLEVVHQPKIRLE